MTRFQKRFFLSLVGLVLLTFVGWFFSAYPRGLFAAYADRVAGHDEIKVFGYPPPEIGEYSRLLRERYGVKMNVVAGCVVTQDLEWYVDGYNSVSEPRIREKFGKDIFEECWNEAKQAIPKKPVDR
ncbi:hypothetical protein [Limnoglobus roseus]|uniref:Uncharacterized protein n=1 Tax=Limnoglobus roseus TaxID=2598579 RepID=A0A5C1A7D2_9BACT|nr:hypothetical protein [Limnoglobus roseus]QEL15179.1 hypothetical protein PX52LOC_02094 [Limnoglobus roseus]